MNYKRLIVLAATGLVVFGTTTAFAFWDQLTAEEQVTNIQIGVGTTTNITEVVEGDTWLDGASQLVPSGAILKTGDTYNASKEFQVTFDGDYTLYTDGIFLDVMYSDLILTDSSSSTNSDLAAPNNLVNIIIQWSFEEDPNARDGSNLFTFSDNELTFSDTDLPDFNEELRDNFYIIVSVSLFMPFDSSEYNIIANKDISFDLEFEVDGTLP